MTLFPWTIGYGVDGSVLRSVWQVVRRRDQHAWFGTTYDIVSLDHRVRGRRLGVAGSVWARSLSPMGLQKLFGLVGRQGLAGFQELGLLILRGRSGRGPYRPWGCRNCSAWWDARVWPDSKNSCHGATPGRCPCPRPNPAREAAAPVASNQLLFEALKYPVTEPLPGAVHARGQIQLGKPQRPLHRISCSSKRGHPRMTAAGVGSVERVSPIAASGVLTADGGTVDEAAVVTPG